MTEPATRAKDALPRAVLAVGATYAYFLLFAEFSFLRHVREAGTEINLRGVMAALGAGGVAGSIAAVWRFRAEVFLSRLAWSYVACALAAAASTLAVTAAGCTVLAAGIGLALGWNTVTLASGLRALLAPARMGWGIGLGTGSAYALCNIPAVFSASATAQAGLSAGLAVLAAVGVRGARTAWTAPVAPAAFRIGRWVGVFLALVWLDSAAFYIIQQTPGLRDATWEGSLRLWGNVGVHLAAALLAGRLLDRGMMRGVTLSAWAALAAACLWLRAESPWTGTGFLYAAGVSLYSTALVLFAAQTGRPAVAATVFAVAGWVGSALGIGMAQDLQVVPVAFVLVSGVSLVAATWRSRGVWLVLIAVMLPAVSARGDDAAALIARGREVYIAEGCLHCHSQYVRPGVAADVERWGPATVLSELLRGAPPLPGNRRQGPDLANVGNRRSADWHRVHLQEPRTVSPGSRMPSYRHLFAAGDARGEALVAYLGSLGADTWEDRWSQVQAWRPAAAAAVIAPAAAARSFARHCASCHGPEGRGDGPLAARLAVPPPDWSRDVWRRVPDGDETILARLIKFGLPGTAMAGHEALTDGEILGLARHVKLMHK